MVEEYLSLIEPYLTDMINDYKSEGEWKLQLTAEINFSSLKPDSNETRIMHTKVITKKLWLVATQMMLLKNSLNRFCRDIKKVCKKKSDFAFDCVNLLYYDFSKISTNRAGYT